MALIAYLIFEVYPKISGRLEFLVWSVFLAVGIVFTVFMIFILVVNWNQWRARQRIQCVLLILFW
jgi:FtsH-binding integral membrane protein